MPSLLCKVTKTGDALLNRSVPCFLSDCNLLIFNDKDKLMQFVTISSCSASLGLKASRVLFVNRAEKRRRVAQSAQGLWTISYCEYGKSAFENKIHR